MAPLILDGCFYISINGVLFENNAMQELEQSLVINYYPSNAITIMRSQGEAYVNSVTVKNQKGLNLQSLRQVLTDEEYSKIVTFEPVERNSNGIPTAEVLFPKYVLDYAFKTPVFKLARPLTDSDLNFQNFLDVLSVDSLKLHNLTQYDPVTEMAMAIDIIND